jgi:hypothetical protein
LDLLCLFFAALCRDAGHTGYGSLSGSCGSDLAAEIFHGGQTAESSKHCALTVKILSDPRSNMLKGLKDTETKYAWDLILRLIVGTDMSNHFKLLSSGKAVSGISWQDYGQKVLGLTLILKIATMSFICREDKQCEMRISDIRAELELDKDLEPNDEEERTEDEVILANRVRREKEVMAFGSLIACPFLKMAIGLLDGIDSLYDQALFHMQRWKLELYPPEESSTSIVIPG